MRAKLVDALPATVLETVTTFPAIETPAGGVWRGTVRPAGTVRTSEVIGGAFGAARLLNDTVRLFVDPGATLAGMPETLYLHGEPEMEVVRFPGVGCSTKLLLGTPGEPVHAPAVHVALPALQPLAMLVTVIVTVRVLPTFVGARSVI